MLLILIIQVWHDSMPICFMVNKDILGCFPLARREFISDSPSPATHIGGGNAEEKKDIWSLNFLVPKLSEFDYTLVSPAYPTNLNSNDTGQAGRRQSAQSF